MTDEFTGKGSCLCGAIHISAIKINKNIGTCHCGMCRNWSGGPFMVADCGIDVSFTGEENLSIFNSSAWAERGFCSKCGTHLFYRLKKSKQYLMSVGLFDNQEMFVFYHQVFIDKKPSFYSFANKTTDMTEAEVFAKYGVS